MTDLDLFFAENVEEPKEVTYVASKRIKDKNGKPVPWRLKPLGEDENAEIKKQCHRRVQVPGKRGVYQDTFDQDLYTKLLVEKSVVFPDLENAQLQDSWQKKTGKTIKDGVSLLRVMLLSGEFDALSIKCQELAGYIDMGELEKDAKN